MQLYCCWPGCRAEMCDSPRTTTSDSGTKKSVSKNARAPYKSAHPSKNSQIHMLRSSGVTFMFWITHKLTCKPFFQWWHLVENTQYTYRVCQPIAIASFPTNILFPSYNEISMSDSLNEQLRIWGNPIIGYKVSRIFGLPVHISRLYIWSTLYLFKGYLKSLTIYKRE